MRLDPKERVALTGLLIESLDLKSEEGVEEAWVAEIEHRMAELDSGAVKPIPWSELRTRLHRGSRAPNNR